MRRAGVLLALLLLLAGLAALWLHRSNSGPPPAVGEIASGIAAGIDLDAPVGGSFSLTGVDGQTVRDTDFRGQLMLIVFGYTYCPDVCPMSLLSVTNALHVLEDAAPETAERIAPIFVTLDPERDSPKVLKRYLKSFHPRITGITGSLPDIQRMATAYAVRFSKVEDEEFSDYLLDHTTNIMLFGPDGAYFTHYSPQTPPNLMADSLARYVR